MNIYFLIFLFFLINEVLMLKTLTKFKSTDRINLPELSMTIDQLILKKGYSCEMHQVTTEDGYILKMFRIKPSGVKKSNRTVLLQHGLFDSSDSWVVNDKNLSLPLILVSQGYEVVINN
jgi:lysosomal acid lipase/cholesteryl ester hydrolase